ncbi:glycoside hydrolase family 2 protein [Bacillus sp. FJAT-26390]|uniref:glycoside hydrolase family 2 protein n=1 Tax=Bacillus sp. FJAT-26390 TaxID=1743142 RepID=UPI000ACCC785|nr:sugar-binding domain-containing protein [Bacillus sp. FJAT-26390]
MTAAKQPIPRPEYPRPQMVRSEWLNLNGEWEFEIDYGKSGKQRNLFEASSLKDKIIVPFCPESKLSGIESKDFMPAVWYRKEIEMPAEWKGSRTLIHFGAVDYETEVWVNGKSAGTHRGGYSSFALDITHLLQAGTNVLTVCAEDDLRSGLQPRGKQSGMYHSHGCDYTRTTGIWQTVWLESVPEQYMQSFKLTPDAENQSLHVEGEFLGADGLTFVVEAKFGGKTVGLQSAVVNGNQGRLTVKLSESHLWEIGSPNLYDLTLSLQHNDKIIDTVESYFGLRSVKWDSNAILINGKPVFQRLVLDQGFYPEGIYTAPTDEDLKRDIELSMSLGFNGARLHEKVFEARFLYWADQLGYIVWGEHANWGLDITTAIGLQQFLPEWMEIVKRDYNSPALVGWCPFNETWDGPQGARQNDEVLRITYQVTKSLDATRPVIDTSGNFHVITDIFDVHDYEQNPEKFAQHYEAMRSGGDRFVTFDNRQKYEGQPYFVSEYGGIWWNPGQVDQKSWGYGDRPRSEEEFISRYEGLTLTLLENPYVCAFCYTQLYDVEQEVNGLLTYERNHKFDPEVIRRINATVAAIEKQAVNSVK